MSISALAREGVFALAAVLLAGPAAQAQAQVRLVPQLGMEHIRSVAVSRDDRFVLTGGDFTARLWDVATGRQIRSFNGHTNAVNSVAFSPDGRFALTGSADETARLWDVTTGLQIRAFLGHTNSVTSVALSADGRFVLTGSKDHTARLWDAATGRYIRSFVGHGSLVLSVAFSPDGRFVLTGSGSSTRVKDKDDRTARLWDTLTGVQIRAFVGSKGIVDSVAFSPNGRFVLTGSGSMEGNDNSARLWDAATGDLVRSFKGHLGWVNSVAFSPDGKLVLTANGGPGVKDDEDDTVRLWSANTGRRIRSFEGHSDDVNSAVFTSDGRFVLSGSGDGTARLWNAATGKQIHLFEGHTHQVNSVAFSPDGKFALTGNEDNGAHLWDLARGLQIRTFNGDTNGIPEVFTSVAFSPDGLSVLAGTDLNKTWQWDAGTGNLINLFLGKVRSVAFSPNGRFVLTGGEDKTARLWEVSTGRLARFYKGHQEAVTSVAFSPNNPRYMVTGSLDKTARLWDGATAEQVRSFNTGNEVVFSVSFSPSGNFLLTGGGSWDGKENTARVWDVANGQQVRLFAGHTQMVLSVSMAPDETSVLTGSLDKTARLWNTVTGLQLRALEGHELAVTSAVFSPAGDFILTGSADTTTRLWDEATGKWLATLLSFENGGWAVVDPEGRFDTSDLDGGAPLAWVVESDPLRALPLEIFMRDYYTPRLLSHIINHEALPPVRSIAEIKNRIQPEVSIVSVTASEVQSGKVDVVVHAAGRVEEKMDAAGAMLNDAQGKALMQASGLQDLRLFRNGQLVANTPLDHPLADGDFKFTDIQLPTSDKSVTFTAYAFNNERIKSPTATKEYAYEPGRARTPRAWLLQIGVNHYQASGCELHGAVNDAEELSGILAQKLKDRGLEVQTPVLLVSDGSREGATKEGIRAALARIAAEATPDDAFFLSFSGHGYGDNNGQFYIFPADIVGSCREVNGTLLNNAISADMLAEWLRPIDAGEMTFVLDSCQSASSVETNDFKPGPMGSRGLGQLAYDKRIRILAASQGNQAAEETNLVTGEGARAGAGESRMRGLLSYALTDEGLLQGKADWKPVDGKITVGEWLTFAADAVPKGLVAGAGRGSALVAEPVEKVQAAQIPAVFDFSKKDTFVLQVAKSPVKP